MPAPIIIKTPRKTYATKSEHDEQADFVSWFKKNYPKIRIYAVPNGANLSGDKSGDQQKDNAARAKQWRYLEAEGASKGHPDLQIPAWKIVIEFKRAKGGQVSPEQQSWLVYYRSIGWDAVVCHGASQAKDFINGFVRRM
jgi:hypothetical protein